MEKGKRRERVCDIERERVAAILSEKEEISCLRWEVKRNQRLRSIPHLKTIQICSSNRLRIDSVSQSIENWFAAVLAPDPICWSIKNRFGCSLVVAPISESIEDRFTCTLDPYLITWSIENRFVSPLIHHPNFQSIENRFKALYQTSKGHIFFIWTPNCMIPKSILNNFSRRIRWRNLFSEKPLARKTM